MSDLIINRRWSISATRAYLACPRQWWLTRVANVDQDNPDANFRGVLMHVGLAAGYAEMARAQREPEGWLPGAVLRRGEAACEFAIAKEADRLRIELEDEPIDTACRALAHLGPQPGDEVLGVEYDMDIRVDGVPIGFRADVIYRRDRILCVTDWKSSSTLPKARDLPKDWQLCLGALCAARTFGDTVVRVGIASIGAAVAVRFPVTADQAQEAGRVVAQTARQAENDLDCLPLPGSACADCKVVAHCPVYAPDGVLIQVPGFGGRPVEVRSSAALREEVYA
jgi:CRISPR/Cas system-associated exonuclease Cas4 (RecB family)